MSSLLAGLNPLGLFQEAKQFTPHEFLRDFYTRRGLHDKLKDVDALVATYATNLPQLYQALDSKYGTNFATHPPPVVAVEIRGASPVGTPSGAAPSTTVPAAVPSRAGSSKPPVNKIIMLGNSGVGKTNLLSRLNKGEFNEEFTSTLGVEFLTHVTQVDGADVKAQIWDTAGQERFQAMMTTYYRKAVGALLIFDVTDRMSLLGVERWLDQLLNVAEPGLHAVLVGNKCDLPAPQRVVTTEEAQQFAAAHHMTYVETSAKTGHNVEAAFQSLIAAIHRTRMAEVGASVTPTTTTTIDLNARNASVTTSTSSSSFFGDCI